MYLHLSVVWVMLLLAGAGPALAGADDYAAQVVSRLQSLGFKEIGVSRTLLGRTRITAATGSGHREIVLDPRTGEILRDLWQDDRGEQEDRTGAGGRSGEDGNDGGGDHEGGGGEGEGEGGDD